uniref:ZP domain-containing protein n=1 Tax=Syphacia muris TaxID=451379 RepID=A0A0N5AKQ2_9BILA
MDSSFHLLFMYLAIFLDVSGIFFDEGDPATKFNETKKSKAIKSRLLSVYAIVVSDKTPNGNEPKPTKTCTLRQMPSLAASVPISNFLHLSLIPLKDHCFRFVDTSLPEIYYTVNYDLTTKHVCISLGLCEGSSVFVEGGVEAVEKTTVTTLPTTTSSTPINITKTTTTTDVPTATSNTVSTTTDPSEVRGIPSLRPSVPGRPISVGIISQVLEPYDKIGPKPEKMADITSFANTVCSKLPSGTIADGCYKLAERKISELSEFVDLQVAEALWCAELNSC